jgi:hypothetical protein
MICQRAQADSNPNVEQARTHFQRGVQYYEDRDYRAALLEFQRAYALQHAYPLLYNLGQVSIELRDYASAERYFRRYLADGASAIAADRRAEVVAEMSRLQTRVGTLRIDTNLPDAEIHIDDRKIKNAEAGVRVSAGQRQIIAEKPGYAPVRRVVDVLGGEQVAVSLSFGPSLMAASYARSEADSAATTWPWVAGITSGVVLLGAAGMGYWAYLESSKYDTELDRLTTQARLDELSSRARDKALVADVLLGVGIAGAALTVVLLVTGGDRESSSTTTPARPALQLGTSGVQLQF